MSIFIEWFDDDGRHRKSLADVVGHPVTDWEIAKECARRMSAAQERKRNQDAAIALNIPTTRTLGELLDQRHRDLESEWSPKYKKSRDRVRTFWFDKLGRDLPLLALNAAVVERIAKEAQGELSDRWRQDVLRYLVDSFIYAETKLKWITSQQNLSAVRMPKVKGKSFAYTVEEAQRLLPALWTVHPVAGWIGRVCAETGRRVGAVRQLRPEDVRTDGRWTLITFPGETDKARNTGTAALYGLPRRTDWTVPPHEHCDDWLRAAETAAEVPHVEGRGYHGLKRLYATLTTGMQGADLQAGTRRETLDAHYRQDVMAPKQDVARHVRKVLQARP